MGTCLGNLGGCAGLRARIRVHTQAARAAAAVRRRRGGASAASRGAAAAQGAARNQVWAHSPPVPYHARRTFCFARIPRPVCYAADVVHAQVQRPGVLLCLPIFLSPDFYADR